MGLREYRIIEKMATGSFGVVFKVRRVRDGEVLVMKRIPLLDLDKAERLEAAQEMFVMGSLHHPFVVAQRDAFLFNGNDLCLIMDYYDGGDLDLAISRQRDADTYFAFDQVMLWFVEMVLALHYLHAHGIVHRDMKTHNLFLNTRTNTIAVGDFGIAERIDGEKANAVAAAATWRHQHQHQQQQQQQQQQQMYLLRRRSSSSTASGSGGLGVVDSPAHRPFSALTRDDESTAAAAADVPLLSAAKGELPPLRPLPSCSDSYTNPSFGSPTPSPMRADAGSLAELTAVAAAAAAAAAAGAPAAEGRTTAGTRVGAGAADDGAKHAAVMKGTPLYMAPEALQGESSGTAVGPLSDVWSLGCILYELLCLRHPFESRDIGALVMRVTKGEREPLPSHYPPAVQELVDWMLALEPDGRPSCREILETPLAAAYLRLLQEKQLHAPACEGRPSSAEAAALAKQMRRFVTEPRKPRDKDVAFFRSQMTAPLRLPSEERELVEKRRQEVAQRAALAMMRASGSARSSLNNNNNNMGGTYSSLHRGASSVGTFFIGGTTPFGYMGDGALPIFYAGQSVEYNHGNDGNDPRTPSFLRNSSLVSAGVGTGGDGGPRDRGEAGGRRVEDDDRDDDCTVIDSSSMQRGSLMPFVLSSPAHSRGSRPGTEHDSVLHRPDSKGSARQPVRSRRSSMGSTRTEGSVPPMTGPRQDRAPSPSLQLVRRPPKPRDPTGRPPPAAKARPQDHSSGGHGKQGGVDLHRAAARQLDLESGSTSSPSPPRGRKTLQGGASDGRAAPAFEELFFSEHRNVRDMRQQPLPVLAEEVVRMRWLVELSLRERQRRRDARGYLAQFGDDLVVTMPATFREVALPAEQRPVTWPAGERAAAVAAAGDAQRPSRRLTSAPVSAAPPDVRWLSPPARQRATSQPQLQPYLLRREALVTDVLKRVSPAALAAVYAYYQRTSMAERDALEVAKLVPDRAAWPVLPLVQEIVVLDKYLEGGTGQETVAGR